MRYRHPSAEAGAAEPFTLFQPLQHIGRRELVRLGEPLREKLENLVLGCGLDGSDRFWTKGKQRCHHSSTNLVDSGSGAMGPERWAMRHGPAAWMIKSRQNHRAACQAAIADIAAS